MGHSSATTNANGTRSKVFKLVKQRVPILGWITKYDRITALSDLIAGVTLGLTLVPQSLAYAALANLPAQYGLYSSFIGTLLYTVFGTIKEVSIGPTSLMALLTLNTCKGLPIEYVFLLTFLSGCMVMMMGLLRLGFIVDLISAPVTNGFTSATAVIILVSQTKGILGIRFKAENVIDNFIKLYKGINRTQWQDIVLGLSCCTFLLLLRKIKDIPVKDKTLKRIFWLLSISRNAVLVMITLFIAYKLDHSELGVPFLLSANVTLGLPPFALPKFQIVEGNTTIGFMEMCSTLGSSIIVVPLVMVLANIAIAKAFRKLGCLEDPVNDGSWLDQIEEFLKEAIGNRVDAGQEMLTLGLCNILGSCVQAMPTTGAFTRSAVSNSSGIKTPMAGIYSGIITLLALSFLTPYFYYIPRATLSAILMCAAIFMIDYQILSVLWRGNKRDFYMLVMTFTTSMLVNVELGLVVGILGNILYLIYLWARPKITVERRKTSTGGEYVTITPDMGLFFLTIDYLKSIVMNAAKNEGENILPIVLDCSRLQNVDYTACQGLNLLSKGFESKIQKIIFYNASPEIINKLETFTSINPTYFRCSTEAEFLDAIFGMKDGPMLKMEAMPLLAEAFRKKDSIVSNYNVRMELTTFINERSKTKSGSLKSIDSEEKDTEENIEITDSKGDYKK